MFVVDGQSEDYLPRPAPLFRPSRIIIAKGSNRTEARRQLAERICVAYPDAVVIKNMACHTIELTWARVPRCDCMSRESKYSY